MQKRLINAERARTAGGKDMMSASNGNAALISEVTMGAEGRRAAIWASREESCDCRTTQVSCEVQPLRRKGVKGTMLQATFVILSQCVHWTVVIGNRKY